MSKIIGTTVFTPYNPDLMSGIGGITYTSIVYNEDNTITLTDKDGAVHTMECAYENDKLIGVTYDGKPIDLTYDGDELVKIGKTAVDVVNAPKSSIEPLDHTVIFIANGEPYEVVSVKDGNQVNAPSGMPTSENGNFAGWKINGMTVNFPYIPTEDTDIVALFTDNVSRIYERLNVDRTAYPYIAIHCNGSFSYVYIFANYKQGTGSTGGLTVYQPYYYTSFKSSKYYGNFDGLVSKLFNTNDIEVELKTTDGSVYNGNEHEYYANFDLVMRGTVYRI